MKMSAGSAFAGCEFVKKARVGCEIERRIALAYLARMDHGFTVKARVEAEFPRRGRATGIRQRFLHHVDGNHERPELPAQLGPDRLKPCVELFCAEPVQRFLLHLRKADLRHFVTEAAA